jgi:uncharacterized repeat protein (TIGR04076 family)
MKPGDPIWKAIQDKLGYNDGEMEEFARNPRNAELIARNQEFASKTIVAEVVDSHGCWGGHTTGTRFCFDTAGNLIASASPKRMCVYALTACTPLIFAASELLYAGADPNGMRFNRTGCLDVGLKCGGWGHVVLEVKVEERT